MKHLTYATYLHLDHLLDLQRPRSTPPEHDEMLFIVAHQVFELWFKLQLHELEKACDDFRQNHVPGAVSTFKRTRTIMKTMVEQIDILETLTPMSFSSFRDRLDTASGFQSVQFREFEFLLGYKRPDMLRFHPPDTPDYERLQRRLREPSVVDCFYVLLEQHGVVIPDELRQRPSEQPSVPNAVVQDGILRLYKGDPQMENLFEMMTDFDEGFQEWRYRHIKLVERTIGSKHGTGGSLGVEFLKKSLFHSFFADLWAIRRKLLIYDITPPVSERLNVWPGDTPARREVLCDMKRGDNLTLSTLRATVHLGAHVDAPSHYGTDAPSIEDRDVNFYLGPCQVVRVPVPRGVRVTREMLPQRVRAERVLLATGTFPDPDYFNEDFAALDPALVECLAREGVRLIGIDTPSVDLFSSKELPAHLMFLRYDLAILEGVVLRDVPEGLYELIALPLRLVGFDASPVRAILRSLPDSAVG